MASPQPKAVPSDAADASTVQRKAAEAFGGRRISPKVAQAAAAAQNLHRQSPPVVREILTGIGLGIMGGAIWKMYHLNWRRKVHEFQEGYDDGIYTTVVYPKTHPALPPESRNYDIHPGL